VLNLVGKSAAHPPPSCRSLAARNIRQWGILPSNRTTNTEAKMKKFAPNGAAIKRIRGQLERLSTQKEFAHEIGVSERTLRQIENENLPVSIITIDRMAKALNVHRGELVFALDSPKIVPSEATRYFYRPFGKPDA
jgi:DNA-binding XRE family transcriptional regulator